MKKRRVFVVLIFIILLCLGLGYYFFKKNDSNKKDSITVEKNPKVTSKYAMSGNGIEDFDLFFLKNENKRQNLIYSPLSLKYALAMLNEGTNGETKSQISSVIGNYSFAKYENTANLSLANALFVKDSEKNEFKQEYMDNLKSKYNASVIFDSFTSASNMNNWVNKNTLGLIHNIVSDAEILENRFVLINALAINMDWNYQIQARTNEEGYQSKYYNIHYSNTTYGDSVPLIVSGESEFKKIKFGNSNLEVPAAQIGATINKYDIVNVLGEENIKKTVGEAYDKQKAKGFVCGEDYYDQETKETKIYSKEEVLENYITEINKHYKDVSISTDFEFYTDDEVKVFAKDLKEYNGITLQYIGLMPINEDLNEYIEKIDSKKISSIINKLKTLNEENFEDGYVYKIKGFIPFFQYEYNLNLKDDLKKLGITNVFDISKSDLSNMTNNKSYVESVNHKANIEFTNEGIKAAAVTTIAGLGASGCSLYDYDLPVKEIDLTFDKPYMYIIRNKKSGEVWFVGTTYIPNKDA